MIMIEPKNADNTATAEDFHEFTMDENQTVSSGAIPRAAVETVRESGGIAISELSDDAGLSPVFKELALPKLPELAKENRAKLLMQTPNNLYFYWSVRSNPFQTLNRALGAETGNYTLALKLVDLKRDSEVIFAVEPEGSWWFDVDADGDYRAEIGFYSPSRPYVRVMFSNTVQTPRKSPSPSVAAAADWKVTSREFAQVLDVAGFAQDAFDVAVAGDDRAASDTATQTAFSRLIGKTEADLAGIASEDIRFALFALASGMPLEFFRWRVSPTLFAILQKHADSLNAEKAIAVLKDEFDIDAEEIEEIEDFGPAVFGASLVNFPKRLKSRKTLPKYAPVSSHGLGR